MWGDVVLVTWSVTIGEAGREFVVTIRGEFDVSTAGTLERALEAVDPLEDVTVVVDLDGVSFIDSRGLGTLLICHRRFAERGITLVVRNPQPQARRLFRTCLGPLVDDFLPELPTPEIVERGPDGPQPRAAGVRSRPTREARRSEPNAGDPHHRPVRERLRLRRRS